MLFEEIFNVGKGNVDKEIYMCNKMKIKKTEVNKETKKRSSNKQKK